MLYTVDIEKFLYKHCYCFCGVYSLDDLPFLENVLTSTLNIFKKAVFVFNTDVSYSMGDHWCACIVYDNKSADFFDSFGRPPNIYLSNMLYTFIYKIDYNYFIVQPYNNLDCGYLCIYFIIKRLYKPNIYLNDFIKNIFCLNNPFYNSNIARRFFFRNSINSIES